MIAEYQATFTRNKNKKRSGEYYINRIYLNGHDSLLSFEEMVHDDFEKILSSYDDPGDAVLRGEAQWRWMTSRPDPQHEGWSFLKFHPFDKKPGGVCVPVTVIRVHRKRNESNED